MVYILMNQNSQDLKCFVGMSYDDAKAEGMVSAVAQAPAFCQSIRPEVAQADSSVGDTALAALNRAAPALMLSQDGPVTGC